MKHLKFILICVLCFASFMCKAQNKTINFRENAAKQGLRLIKSNASKIELSYAIADFNLTENTTLKSQK